VLEAFPESFPAAAGARWTGNPLRREIAALRREPGRAPNDPPNLLVVGGSLGAKALNEALPAALAITALPVKVRHQTGEAMQAETAARYAEAGIEARVDAFVEDMAEAYAWADLAVCRAGAMTVSELSAAGVPAILIPFPHAIDDHQTQNARYLAEAGAAVLLPQTELTPERLATEIAGLLNHPDRLKSMSAKAAALAKPEAARTVAGICIEQAKP
jgi:UDP-N-acetylglucosamine--N-acetylmuramyl-(pentapeptide) pyrophosphoryl-undecaprenol N-acetylglucosamine transferase